MLKLLSIISALGVWCPSGVAEKPNRAGEFMELVYLFSHVPPKEQLRRLPSWMENKFRYRPECVRSFVGGISDTQCLLGMRSVARAIASGKTPEPQEIITLKINDDHEWKGLESSTRLASMSIPYSATPAEMERFFEHEFNRPNYRRRIKTIERIDDYKSQIEHLTRTNIEIDDDLDNDVAATGLYKVLMIARENPTIFKAKSESLRLSHSFVFPYERNLKLKEDINANASVTEIRDFLRDINRKASQKYSKPGWPDYFFEERNSLSIEKIKLANVSHIGKVDCLDSGSLKQFECLQTIARIGWVLSYEWVELPQIDLLIILGTEVMPEVIDFYTEKDSKKSVLLIRSDFFAGSLTQFLKDKGWVKASAEGKK